MSTSRRRSHPAAPLPEAGHPPAGGESPAGKGAPVGDEPLAVSPFDGDLEAELAPRPQERRTSRLTMALGAGVLLVAGMIAGIQAQKLWGEDGGRQGLGQSVLAGGGLRAGGAAGAPGAGTGMPGAGQGRGQGAGPGQGAGAGQGGGAFGGVTVGTVKLVDGRKIYLETAGGAVVTVTTSDDTSVQVSREGRVKDLKPGGTLVIRGERAEDGSLTATTITQGGTTRTGG
ncbi:hypothetical protein [Sphaerisporangium sp. TRM90804]|uniref:hypothetical protein n=1 Tax=Sphaerisporangium sp. TRM90804 TaxID=3031113 RepID=UPI00244A9B78|nr:hypothetical protein [Sphaerisporangium sp. TRM90804]MDH2430380.1 hypothetical protein [Sphaerisporangium sp. TRM90804]